MREIRTLAVQRLDLRFEPRPWPFAAERRAEIDAHFASLRRERPHLWNGKVMLLHQWDLSEDCFHGACFETDFASMLAWRDWEFPDEAVRNFFAQGALRSADGAFLLGVMSAHTANAGKIYFPSGTPDPNDLRGGSLDMDASVMRELKEETGLEADEVEPQPDWHLVFAGLRIGMIKVLQSAEPEDVLRARILQNLAHQEQPELAGIHVARGPGDLDPNMPAFVPAFLRAIWQSGRN